MLNDGEYQTVDTVHVIGEADACNVSPVRDLMDASTLITICHVTVSPEFGVLPSCDVDMGRLKTTLPVLDVDVLESEKPPVPLAVMVIESVFQSTSVPEAVHETVTRIAITSVDST